MSGYRLVLIPPQRQQIAEKGVFKREDSREVMMMEGAPRAGREHDQGPLGGAGIETFLGGRRGGLVQRYKNKMLC